LSHTEPHDEFLELCAVSTSGQLTQEERKKLDEHLTGCSSCREAIKQYELLVAHAVPAIAAEELSGEVDPGPSWSEQRAEAALFNRIAQAESCEKIHQRHELPEVSDGSGHAVPFGAGSTWRNIWTLYAASALLAAALGICLYQVGMRRGVDSAKLMIPAQLPQNQTSLEAQLSDTAHERELALGQLAQRDHEIVELRKILEQQTASMAAMKLAADRLAAERQQSDTSNKELAQRETDFKQKLQAAEANTQSLQQKLDAVGKQYSEEQTRAAQLNAQVNELTQSLRNRDTALDEKDELLAKDRDIRELMGARDLYVAEVYDVNRNGKTQKPYGRVFFTKGKSLIFYAYDLDREPDIKTASAFQVWGQRGPDRQQALNLGIFYEDNAAKKRWVLKLDDPKMLAQIDAVFVTVEPPGGSRRPSGTQLLFAYLKADPNHP